MKLRWNFVKNCAPLWPTRRRAVSTNIRRRWWWQGGCLNSSDGRGNRHGHGLGGWVVLARVKLVRVHRAGVRDESKNGGLSQAVKAELTQITKHTTPAFC